jgi:hypothetical protein
MVASLLASTAFATGCGDSNLEETEVPQLALDQETPTTIELRMPNAEGKQQSQTPIRFRNSGKADMTVTSVSWVANPDRLVGAGSYDGTRCDYDSTAGSNLDASDACNSNTFCWENTNECRQRGFPATPFTVPSGQLHELDVVLLPGTGEFSCPEPPAGREVPDDYCGELLVETNASNDGPEVTGGKLRIFFTFAVGSGTIAPTPSSINFSGVNPDGADSKPLTITNIASEGVLSIEQLRIQDHVDMFTINGPASAELDPNQGEDWTVEFTPPSDWVTDLGVDTSELCKTCTDDSECGGAEDLCVQWDAESDVTTCSQSCDLADDTSCPGSFECVENADGVAQCKPGQYSCVNTIGTNVEILSSATNERTSLVPVTASKTQERAVIKVDPLVLSFSDATSKTLTISNEGTKSLKLQSFSADSAYSFSVDGAPFDPNSPNSVPSNHSVIQKGTSKDFTVDYDASAATGTAVGTLQIGYSYFIDETNSVSKTANVTLLGDLGDAPVGLVSPDTFLLLEESGTTQTRSFVVRNVGTQALDITAATLSDDSGDFSVVGDPTGSVAAGELHEVTVEHTGTDDQPDNVTLTLESNTAGDDMSVLLVADTATASGDLEAKITPGFAGDTAVVGAEARFSARQSTVGDSSILDEATWVSLARPSGSSAFLESSGSDVSFFPDVAGEYKVSLLINALSGASSQVTYTFNAVE